MDRKVLVLGILVLAVVIVVGLVMWSGSKKPPSPQPNTPENTTVTDNHVANPTAATSTANLATIPEATPTAWPTPERVIVSKAKGNDMMQELNQRTREVQEGLQELKKQGKDTRDYQSKLRTFNRDLSQAGYRLFTATDTVSTQAAEEHIISLREQLNALATEAGVQ